MPSESNSIYSTINAALRVEVFDEAPEIDYEVAIRGFLRNAGIGHLYEETDPPNPFSWRSAIFGKPGQLMALMHRVRADAVQKHDWRQVAPEITKQRSRPRSAHLAAWTLLPRALPTGPRANPRHR